jgi:hypothetical protein
VKIHPAQLKRYEKNLEELILFANDEEVANGIGWYYKAHNICKELSSKYAVPFNTVCQVMAILSPAASWLQNVVSCERMLQAFANNQPISSFHVTTYNQNKEKAWKVLHGRDTFTLTRNNYKTYSFYWNIAFPYDDERVTIDRHAFKAMEGITKAGNKSFGVKYYRKAQHVYKKCAEKYHLTPNQFQAIVWLAYKRKVGR